MLEYDLILISSHDNNKIKIIFSHFIFNMENFIMKENQNPLFLKKKV